MGVTDISIIAEAMKDLKWYIAAIIALIILIIRFFAWLDKRDIRRLQAVDMVHKEERSRRLHESLVSLAQSVREHDYTVKSVINDHDLNIRSIIGPNIDKLRSIDVKIDGISKKVRGSMSIDCSLNIISGYFSNMCFQIQRVVEQSLFENDYESRREHVCRKIKTSIAQIICDTRDSVKNIKVLAFDPSIFFIVRVSDSNDFQSERFKLCDILWSVVESCYSKSDNSIKDKMGRIEESRLLIENVISDYFTSVASKLNSDIVSALEPKKKTADDSTGSHSVNG